MKNPKRFHLATAPAPLPENIVTADCTRFTVLTPCLIRTEYAPNGSFEDRSGLMGAIQVQLTLTEDAYLGNELQSLPVFFEHRV